MKTHLIKILSVLLLSFLFLVLLSSCKPSNLDTDTEGVSETNSDEKSPSSLRLDVLKVGKADCIVINIGDTVIMIDTAEAENYQTISAYMQKMGYEKIDMLILTHYDKDHIGGASQIIQNYNVKTVIENQNTDTSSEYLSYHAEIVKQKTELLKLSENYEIKCEDFELYIDIPKKKKYETKQNNNSSLAVTLKHGKSKLVFLGDAMELRVSELVNSLDTNYDFVKLPHHGAYLENYDILLDVLNPKYCAITDSKKNPADSQTIDLLSLRSIEFYQTRFGQITVFGDGKSLTVKQ